jgi:uncharacterized membrane protein YsdA (DUF1294 family)/cold shock CspA family protein
MIPGPTRFEGTLMSWKDERGFGFIAPSHGGENIFVHIKSFPAGTSRPQIGESLTYEVGRDSRGKNQATRVLPAHPPATEKPLIVSTRAKPGNASYFAIPAFLLLYVLVRLAWYIPLWVVFLYLGASVLCFAMYAVDKRAARTRQWRVPEQSLLLLGLIGGWPGAIVAQQTLRHKTKKSGFRGRFWGSVLLNVFLFVGLSSPAFANLVAILIKVWLAIFHH